MLQAVTNKQNFKSSNTEVKTINGAVFVALHGNLIFASINGKKYYSNAGWNTNTTASRLRALGANYSTNFKKCNCELTSYQKMINLFYSVAG